MIIDDQADYRRLLSHHISARWPDAVILEFDPRRSGRLPDGFSGAGHELVLLGDPAGGGEALDWLRRFRRVPQFPPVLFIGSGDERQVVAAIKAGAEDYLGRASLSHARLVQAMEPALGLAVADGAAAAEAWPTLRGYELLGRLAAGGAVPGAARVFLGREQATGRELVLKVLGVATADDSLLDRFLHEYELVARIRHPGVVRIEDLGVTDDHAYIAMEHCAGGNLRERIHAGMAPAAALAATRDIAAALAALHGIGVLHRDLKPSNILFRADGSLALTDFGLARQAGGPGELRGLGPIFGTPAYMSPEQGHGQQVDARGDLYSLGIVLFEMLTGQQPYAGDNPLALIIQHRQAPVPRLPGPLADWQPVLDRLLAKDPAGRYQDAAELLEALPTPG